MEVCRLLVELGLRAWQDVGCTLKTCTYGMLFIVHISSFIVPPETPSRANELLQQDAGAIALLAIFLVESFEDLEDDLGSDPIGPAEWPFGVVRSELHRRVDIAGGGDAFHQRERSFVDDHGEDAGGDEA